MKSIVFDTWEFKTIAGNKNKMNAYPLIFISLYRHNALIRKVFGCEKNNISIQKQKTKIVENSNVIDENSGRPVHRV